MATSDTRTQAIKILARAGYGVKYGGDGYLHILPIASGKWGKVARGTKALCGATASRWDTKDEKEPCQECLKVLLPNSPDGELILVPAWEQAN